MDLEDWSVEANRFVRLEAIRCRWRWRSSKIGVGGDGGHPRPVPVATHEQHQCAGEEIDLLYQHGRDENFLSNGGDRSLRLARLLCVGGFRSSPPAKRRSNSSTLVGESGELDSAHGGG
ncbi:hypothetical protein Ddye_008760 [Dipteronia dyeriana]|uniref:Uncharacterized protein n=1 Tax=Dipteronia dyeriana TaxID=168575 RepID=A0AAE0CM81_9ROSI|nr:hypothetical protein Ddye_008760 [Dipteronia dyeriana]